MIWIVIFSVVYVWLRLLTGRTALHIVLGLGLAQMLVHFRCFLHIGLKRNNRADLQSPFFSTLIIAPMIGERLVTLFNFYHRMM